MNIKLFIGLLLMAVVNLSQAADGGMQVGLNGIFSVGSSNYNDASLADLQGGGHDPARNGFTLQNLELTLSGAVDPFWDAQANLIFLIDAEGESLFEVEEVYMVSRALPAGLQFKVGQFFTEFGRHNTQHPHRWSFVDQPVIASRLLGGDGLRSQGARLAWLMPLGWYSEFYLSMQNPNGETTASFVAPAFEDDGNPAELAGYTLQEREVRGSQDMMIGARWLNGGDLSDNLSMNLGLSSVTGPNAGGAENVTTLLGADLYMKWQPSYSQRGFPFIAWHSETMSRDYQVVDGTQQKTLKDSGYFSQLLWGFKTGWVAAVRYENASAEGGNTGYVMADDAMRNERSRSSVSLSWYPSEFSKIRLQYNQDNAEHLADQGDTVWLQWEFGIGSHAAHVF